VPGGFGTGGSGGGGNGGSTTSGAVGTANTGGGGGGGGASGASTAGGTGGAGVVILRYADSLADFTSIGGGLTYTLTTTGGYKIYRFTAGTGTVTI
jgi:hypothetical protein